MGAFGIFRRELGSGAWKSLASLAVPPLLIFTLLFRLEMFKFGETYLSVSPDMIILVASIPYLVMDFGPLFLLAAFSILSFHLGKAESYAYNNKNLLHIMIVTCLIFMFFINVKGVGSTQVLRKGGYILRIPLMMLAAVSVQNLLWKENWKGTLRQVRTGTIVLAVLVATSVPSILIDIYTINDAAQVRPTEIVSPAEMEAYRWIRSNTDERDIVQGVNTDITGVVAFAERRTFLGDWEHARMFQVGARRVAERHDGVLNGILQGTEASEVAKNLRRFGIKYLMLKDNFNQKMTFTLNQLKRAGDMFRTVYEKDGVFIFQVVNGSSSMESRKNRR